MLTGALAIQKICKVPDMQPDAGENCGILISAVQKIRERLKADSGASAHSDARQTRMSIQTGCTLEASMRRYFFKHSIQCRFR